MLRSLFGGSEVSKKPSASSPKPSRSQAYNRDNLDSRTSNRHRRRTDEKKSSDLRQDRKYREDEAEGRQLDSKDGDSTLSRRGGSNRGPILLEDREDNIGTREHDRIKGSQGSSFNAQISNLSFTQFPGQYSSGPPQHSSQRSTINSDHTQDRFSGQDSALFAQPFKISARTNDEFGHAADYYGDKGESVHHQPGVRPATPNMLHSVQPHSMATLQTIAPPRVTETSSTPDGYAGKTLHVTPVSRPKQKLVSSYGSSSATGRAPRRSESAKSSPYSKVPLHASTSGLPPSVYESQHSHASLSRNPSCVPSGSTTYTPSSLAMHSYFKHKDPLSSFVEWWKAHEDVSKMEEYTEYIGVCSRCFDPRTSSRDAPRKHYYHKRRSAGSLRNGRPSSKRSSNERLHVDKDSRYQQSSSEEGKKKSNKSTWLGAGITGYGLDTVANVLWKQSKEFGDSGSLQTGHYDRSDSYDSRPSLSRGKNSPTIRGVTTRGSRTGPSENESFARASRDSRVKDATSGATHNAAKTGTTSDHSSHRSQRPQGVDADASQQFRDQQWKCNKSKEKDLFRVESLSSSSEDLVLGGNVGSSKRSYPSRKRGKGKERSVGNLSAMVLDLGAAATALVATQGRNRGKQLRRGGQVYAVREPRSKTAKKRENASALAGEKDWVSASDDSDVLSIDSDLAFGDLDNDGSPKKHHSMESLKSNASGTGKWDWRWKRKEASRSHPSDIGDERDPLAVLGVPGNLTNAMAPSYSGSSMTTLPTMQTVEPVPVSDQPETQYSSDLQPPLSLPEPVPLQQPQARAPISPRVYATSPSAPSLADQPQSLYNSMEPFEPSHLRPGALEHYEENPVGRESQHVAQDRLPSNLRKVARPRSCQADLSPGPDSVSPGAISGGLIGAAASLPSSDRLSTADSPGVRFDLTHDQIEKERKLDQNSKKTEKGKPLSWGSASEDHRSKSQEVVFERKREERKPLDGRAHEAQVRDARRLKEEGRRESALKEKSRFEAEEKVRRDAEQAMIDLRLEQARTELEERERLQREREAIERKDTECRSPSRHAGQDVGSRVESGGYSPPRLSEQTQKLEPRGLQEVDPVKKSSTHPPTADHGVTKEQHSSQRDESPTACLRPAPSGKEKESKHERGVQDVEEMDQSRHEEHMPGSFDESPFESATQMSGALEESPTQGGILETSGGKQFQSQSGYPFYHSPFAETVSDVAFKLDSPGTEGTPPQIGWVEGELKSPIPNEKSTAISGNRDLLERNRSEQDLGDLETRVTSKLRDSELESAQRPDLERSASEREPLLASKLSKKEQRKRDKVQRQRSDPGGDLASMFTPDVAAGSAVGGQSPTIEELEHPRRLTKKEQKKRDKLRRQGLDWSTEESHDEPQRKMTDSTITEAADLESAKLAWEMTDKEPKKPPFSPKENEVHLQQQEPSQATYDDFKEVPRSKSKKSKGRKGSEQGYAYDDGGGGGIPRLDTMQKGGSQGDDREEQSFLDKGAEAVFSSLPDFSSLSPAQEDASLVTQARVAALEHNPTDNTGLFPAEQVKSPMEPDIAMESASNLLTAPTGSQPAADDEQLISFAPPPQTYFSSLPCVDESATKPFPFVSDPQCHKAVARAHDIDSRPDETDSLAISPQPECIPKPPARTTSFSNSRIPLSFRFGRPPLSPSAAQLHDGNRDIGNSDLQSFPSTSPNTPRSRGHIRLGSSEFQPSTELRPLYLPERNRKTPEVEELLPSLPSSKTTSVASSVRGADDEYQSALEDQDSSGLESSGLLSFATLEADEADMLDSGQTTPKATDFSRGSTVGTSTVNLSRFVQPKSLCKSMTNNNLATHSQSQQLPERVLRSLDAVQTARAAEDSQTSQSDGHSDRLQKQASERTVAETISESSGGAGHTSVSLHQDESEIGCLPSVAGGVLGSLARQAPSGKCTEERSPDPHTSSGELPWQHPNDHDHDLDLQNASSNQDFGLETLLLAPHSDRPEDQQDRLAMGAQRSHESDSMHRSHDGLRPGLSSSSRIDDEDSDMQVTGNVCQGERAMDLQDVHSKDGLDAGIHAESHVEKGLRLEDIDVSRVESQVPDSHSVRSSVPAPVPVENVALNSNSERFPTQSETNPLQASSLEDNLVSQERIMVFSASPERTRYDQQMVDIPVNKLADTEKEGDHAAGEPGSPSSKIVTSNAPENGLPDAEANVYQQIPEMEQFLEPAASDEAVPTPLKIAIAERSESPLDSPERYNGHQRIETVSTAADSLQSSSKASSQPTAPQPTTAATLDTEEVWATTSSKKGKRAKRTKGTSAASTAALSIRAPLGARSILSENVDVEDELVEEPIGKPGDVAEDIWAVNNRKGKTETASQHAQTRQHEPLRPKSPEQVAELKRRDDDKEAPVSAKFISEGVLGRHSKGDSKEPEEATEEVWVLRPEKATKNKKGKKGSAIRPTHAYQTESARPNLPEVAANPEQRDQKDTVEDTQEQVSDNPLSGKEFTPAQISTKKSKKDKRKDKKKSSGGAPFATYTPNEPTTDLMASRMLETADTAAASPSQKPAILPLRDLEDAAEVPLPEQEDKERQLLEELSREPTVLGLDQVLSSRRAADAGQQAESVSCGDTMTVAEHMHLYQDACSAGKASHPNLRYDGGAEKEPCDVAQRQIDLPNVDPANSISALDKRTAPPMSSRKDWKASETMVIAIDTPLPAGDDDLEEEKLADESGVREPQLTECKAMLQTATATEEHRNLEQLPEDRGSHQENQVSVPGNSRHLTASSASSKVLSEDPPTTFATLVTPPHHAVPTVLTEVVDTKAPLKDYTGPSNAESATLNNQSSNAIESEAPPEVGPKVVVEHREAASQTAETEDHNGPPIFVLKSSKKEKRKAKKATKMNGGLENITSSTETSLQRPQSHSLDEALVSTQAEPRVSTAKPVGTAFIDGMSTNRLVDEPAEMGRDHDITPFVQSKSTAASETLDFPTDFGNTTVEQQEESRTSVNSHRGLNESQCQQDVPSNKPNLQQSEILDKDEQTEQLYVTKQSKKDKKKGKKAKTTALQVANPKKQPLETGFREGLARSRSLELYDRAADDIAVIEREEPQAEAAPADAPSADDKHSPPREAPRDNKKDPVGGSLESFAAGLKDKVPADVESCTYALLVPLSLDDGQTSYSESQEKPARADVERFSQDSLSDCQRPALTSTSALDADEDQESMTQKQRGREPGKDEAHASESPFEEVERDAATIGRPVSPEERQIEFAATLAAGLEDAGFDPSIVIDDPTLQRDTSSPLGSSLEADDNDLFTPKKPRSRRRGRQTSFPVSCTVVSTEFEEEREVPDLEGVVQQTAGSSPIPHQPAPVWRLQHGHSETMPDTPVDVAENSTDMTDIAQSQPLPDTLSTTPHHIRPISHENMPTPATMSAVLAESKNSTSDINRVSVSSADEALDALEQDQRAMASHSAIAVPSIIYGASLYGAVESHPHVQDTSDTGLTNNVASLGNRSTIATTIVKEAATAEEVPALARGTGEASFKIVDSTKANELTRTGKKGARKKGKAADDTDQREGKVTTQTFVKENANTGFPSSGTLIAPIAKQYILPEPNWTFSSNRDSGFVTDSPILHEAADFTRDARDSGYHGSPMIPQEIAPDTPPPYHVSEGSEEVKPGSHTQLWPPASLPEKDSTEHSTPSRFTTQSQASTTGRHVSTEIPLPLGKNLAYTSRKVLPTKQLRSHSAAPLTHYGRSHQNPDSPSPASSKSLPTNDTARSMCLKRGAEDMPWRAKKRRSLTSLSYPNFREVQQLLSPASPPLRRETRSLSRDLPAVSKCGETKMAQWSAEPPHGPSRTPPPPAYLEHDPAKDQSRGLDMASVHEGWGNVPHSPRSPTRPPNVQKRQSRHILDLETQLGNIVSENEALQNAKARAEQIASEAKYQRDLNQHALAEVRQTRDARLREKDAELNHVRGVLLRLQEDISRLTNVNQELKVANQNLSDDVNNRYAQLQLETAEVHDLLRASEKEAERLRQENQQLSRGVEEVIRDGISHAIEERDQEITRLQDELSTATAQIRSLQQHILASKTNDSFLTVRDEDYFDSACQQLCQHVQQWVLRFSKFSDNRTCRLSTEIRDEKTETRLDNAMLDGSNVDVYLADRVQRRDVFMSVAMYMIWEFIFTRYLFGMDREQRQKLKSLEKLLAEVGPQRAVAHWRATTLTLLSRRPAFQAQRAQDTDAVVHEIYSTLATLLPPPSHLENQIIESLRSVLHIAVTLSIDFRTQRPEYVMLPPLQPEYDTNGDLTRKVYFNASLMNERSGDTISNEELERKGSVVRIVLFPLVVKKGDDLGEGSEEIVIAPAQVLVAKPLKDRKVVRVLSGAEMIQERLDSRAMRSQMSIDQPSTLDMSNVI